jgi:hypothetical protein
MSPDGSVPTHPAANIKKETAVTVIVVIETFFMVKPPWFDPAQSTRRATRPPRRFSGHS